MAVRVLRLLEYTYPDAEAALEDMECWAVQNTYRPKPQTVIRSAVLHPEFTDDQEG